MFNSISMFSNKLEQQDICLQNILFVYGNTGIYIIPFITVMHTRDLNYWVVPAIKIKRSQGVRGGKNDKADAKVMALYGLIHQDNYVPIIFA